MHYPIPQDSILFSSFAYIEKGMGTIEYYRYEALDCPCKSNRQ